MPGTGTRRTVTVTAEAASRSAAPAAGPSARAVFGDRLVTVQRFADVLATTGVDHGVLGPRETPRLWDRHLVGAALLGPLVPRGARVCDVGSGAGLPGIGLAVVRPDLDVTLLEPLARRTAFLDRTVEHLGLSAVHVVRGRATGGDPPAVDADGAAVRVGQFDVVLARAVAALDRLLPWLVALARPGGVVLAVKGGAAATELAAAGRVVAALPVSPPTVVSVGEGEEGITVVRVDVRGRR